MYKVIKLVCIYYEYIRDIEEKHDTEIILITIWARQRVLCIYFSKVSLRPRPRTAGMYGKDNCMCSSSLISKISNIHSPQKLLTGKRSMRHDRGYTILS